MSDVMRKVGLDLEVGRDNIFSEEDEVWASTFNAVKKAYAKIGEKRCDHCPNRGIATEKSTDWSYMI